MSDERVSGDCVESLFCFHALNPVMSGMSYRKGWILLLTNMCSISIIKSMVNSLHGAIRNRLGDEPPWKYFCLTWMAFWVTPARQKIMDITKKKPRKYLLPHNVILLPAYIAISISHLPWTNHAPKANYLPDHPSVSSGTHGAIRQTCKVFHQQMSFFL